MDFFRLTIYFAADILKHKKDSQLILNDQTMRSDTKQKLHIAITIAVMAFIFIHSAMPGDVSSAESIIIVSFISKITGMDPQPLSIIVRKLAHFTEFTVLGACLAVNVRDRAVMHSDPVTGKKLGAPAWLIGTAYAVTDELHQYFVPGRACAFTDICIDSAGVAAGAIIAVVIMRR